MLETPVQSLKRKIIEVHSEFATNYSNPEFTNRYVNILQDINDALKEEEQFAFYMFTEGFRLIFNEKTSKKTLAEAFKDFYTKYKVYDK